MTYENLLTRNGSSWNRRSVYTRKCHRGLHWENSETRVLPYPIPSSAGVYGVRVERVVLRRLSWEQLQSDGVNAAPGSSGMPIHEVPNGTPEALALLRAEIWGNEGVGVVRQVTQEYGARAARGGHTYTCRNNSISRRMWLRDLQ